MATYLNVKSAVNTTKFSAAALGKNLLVKLGTDPSTVHLTGAATDLPFGFTTGSADASGKEVPVQILGTDTGKTVTATAGCRILVNKPVFPAVSGKVQVLPDVAGTYYQVGFAVTAAAADGAELQIVTCVPHPVTVTE